MEVFMSDLLCLRPSSGSQNLEEMVLRFKGEVALSILTLMHVWSRTSAGMNLGFGFAESESFDGFCGKKKGFKYFTFAF